MRLIDRGGGRTDSHEKPDPLITLSFFLPVLLIDATREGSIEYVLFNIAYCLTRLYGFGETE